MSEFILADNIISKHYPLFQSKSNRFVLSGGRSSFKTSAICIKLVLDLMTEANAGHKVNVVTFMNVRDEVRQGTYSSIKWAIEHIGVDSLFKVKISPMEIEYIGNNQNKPNGSKIHFYGLNGKDAMKATNIPNIIDMWFEELDQFPEPEKINATLDTFIRYTPEWRNMNIIYSYNPPKSKNHWVVKFTEKEIAKGAEYSHVTYLDDEKHFLKPFQIQHIESIRDTDKAWYDYAYLGIAGTNGTPDFAEIVSGKDFELTDRDYLFAGIDSSTHGKDSTVMCVVAINLDSGLIKLIDFVYFNDEWIDGYTSYVIVNEIIKMSSDLNINAIYVDRAYGQHIVDGLESDAYAPKTKPIDFGGRITDDAGGRQKISLNKRAEMYTTLSDALYNKRVMAYCDTSIVQSQLDATEFETTTNKIKVIDKDIIKKRIAQSPDEADSLALAVFCALQETKGVLNV